MPKNENWREDAGWNQLTTNFSHQSNGRPNPRNEVIPENLNALYLAVVVPVLSKLESTQMYGQKRTMPIHLHLFVALKSFDPLWVWCEGERYKWYLVAKVMAQ